MQSLIPEYNYDIFISYRQKDNKYDGWVTEFVDHLKKELEATFKEEVSVYFDINPSDYLLESYDVDASLKDKLKCLVFVPILSRTYCDSKSFAWVHEFKAFVELASKDQFGLKIKLPNGNVASRVLPVRIHDLDPSDIKECESVLGGVLRGIEFIYKEAGIDKPLAPDDDEKRNLNNTKYRIQIIKVAHSIKEIILGMKNEPTQVKKEKEQPSELVKEVREDEQKVEREKPTKVVKIKFLIPATVVTLLIIAGIIAYPTIFKQDKLEKLRSSGEKITVAVMPFQNMTNDTTWNIWQDGIQNELITYLTNSEELKVRQTESINTLIQSKGFTNYASITPSVASKISQKLDANIFIYGSIKQVGPTLRINAQLIDSKTQDTFKSFQIDGIAEDILYIVDSLSNQIKNFIIISELEKELPVGSKYYKSTNSPEAFRYFIYGQNAFHKSDFSTAIKLFSQALMVDSNFTVAALRLSTAYLNQRWYNESMIEKAKDLCLKLYKKRDQMPPELKININKLYATIFETPYEEIQYLRQLLELDDQSPVTYYSLGYSFSKLDQYDKAIPAFEKSLEIYDKWGTKPMWSYNYSQLGISYHETGQYKKEKKLYKKAEQDFPDNSDLLRRQAILSLTEGDTVAANESIRKYLSLSSINDITFSEVDSISNLAYLYYFAEIWDKAERLFRKALSLEPENPKVINALAWLLIEKDRNINEGIQLIDKALALSNDDWAVLDTKGWGLFKQGKYPEALEFLQKSWELKPVYDHELYLHLEAVKKALEGQKNK